MPHPPRPQYGVVYPGRSIPRPPKLEREIVVSRFQEDTGWLDLIPTGDHITLYNKGPAFLPPLRQHSLINLENRGRESGTMLHHIVRHYDDLAEWTFFLQGDALVHQEDILKRVAVQWPGLTPLSTRYLPAWPTPEIVAKDKIEWVNTSGGEFEVRYGDALASVEPGSTPWFDRAAWPFLFRGPMPQPLWFGYAAMWAVPREAIRCRSRAWYQWLQSQLLLAGDTVKSHTVPPSNGFALEVLWLYIWSPAYHVQHQ